MVLEATNREQTAADAHFSGFDARAFTYLLTQYLWQQTSTVESAIAHINQIIHREYEQTPHADGGSGDHQVREIEKFSNLFPET